MEAAPLRQFLIDTVPAMRDRPGATDPAGLPAALILNVSFTYDGARRGLGLTFAAQPGETVALVGDWRRKIDRTHVAAPGLRSSRCIKATALMCAISRSARFVAIWVFQEALLLNRSIAEIWFGKPDASHEQMRDARHVKSACFIDANPDGFDACRRTRTFAFGGDARRSHGRC